MHMRKQPCRPVEIGENLADKLQCPPAFGKETVAKPVKVHQYDKDTDRTHKGHYLGKPP